MSRAPMPASMSALMLSQQLDVYLQAPDPRSLEVLKAMFDQWVAASMREQQELRQQLTTLTRRLDAMEHEFKTQHAA